MDCALNPKLEKETIYEIYRGCRLCGAGAGYKMPIMQNVLDTEDSELNLSQKIRECVQIEVHPDDKMPPLICELCVDKVNDFYEFLDLCRQTNKQTRLKLGLPLHNARKEVQESTDCILGDTEPVYINSDSDVEPLSKKSKPKSKEKKKTTHKSTMKTELQHNINLENILSTDRSSRSCRTKRRSPTPPPARVLRTSSVASNEKLSSQTPPRITRTSVSEVTSKNQESSKKSKATPTVKKEVKSIMKKEKEEVKVEAKPQSSIKRSREKDIKVEVPQKKVKLVIEAATPKSKSKVVRPKSPPVVATEVVQTCPVCGQKTRTSIGYHNHMRSHVVCFTNTRLACNACGEWFPTLTEASAHHKWHQNVPYKCRRCTADFQTPEEYDDHFGKKQCVPFDEVADVRCDECWRHFATDRLLIEHHCAGVGGRPGGKCPKCNRTYVLLKNLIRHESTCLHRRRSEINTDPEIMDQLLPVQVRVARCDPLLKNIVNNHYDVHNIENYGFDTNCKYPYSTHIKVKSEPFEGMVKINEEIEKEFLSKDVWDSENSDNEVDKLQSLRALALKNVALKENDEEPKDISVINSDVANDVNVKDSEINKSTLSDKDQNILKENGAEKSAEDSKTEVEESSMKEIDTKNEESLERDANIESVSASEIETQSNGIDKGDPQDLVEKLNEIHNGAKKMENGIEKKENDLENGTEAFNNADESEFDSEIDGDKLMAALNAQIGEDDDDTQNNGKDAAKDNIDEEKNNFGNEEKSLDKKNDKLNLDELLAKDKSMDLDTISDEDFNFDV